MPHTPPTEPSRPSAFYRAEFWRLGLWLTRHLPHPTRVHLSQILARLYWTMNRHRRQIVIHNLAPAFKRSHPAAQHASRQLFEQFALKIVDLWRYENGEPIQNLFSHTSHWHYFKAAQGRGQGILLLTVHIGNWEFGGPLLVEKGVQLHVITSQEPDQALTRIRQIARARWGIQTLVIGQDPFAFLDVIRQLQKGATVALLMDRPPPPTAVTVNLFGQPFAASIAAAELARASGCALLPVLLPRHNDGYVARLLPEIPYDRRALPDREARRSLTQQIINAFEPFIREYITQWYHFVPVWPHPTPAPSPPPS